jgi:alpha-D-ribose 1-methylphosphonate 5-triphosphate synthase subunit PhnL
LLAVFVFVLVAAAALLYYYYETQKAQIRQRIENELVAISNLKADQIINWRKERLGDADTISNNSFIIPDIRYFLYVSNEPRIRTRILKWIGLSKEATSTGISCFSTQGAI